MLPVVTGCGQQSSSSSSSSSGGSASDPVVARVNGVEIRESDLAMAEEDLGTELQQLPPEHRREQLISYVADVILAAQAAEARKLQNTDDFKQRDAFIRSKLLMGLMLQDQARSLVTDEALRKVYDERSSRWARPGSARPPHPVPRRPEGRKGAGRGAGARQRGLERIKKGEDFATVASELTEDPSGKENGGDLGYFTKDQMVPEFAKMAFKMEPGQMSNPVQTQFGWHIIKLEDRRNRPVPEFDKVKQQIETFLVRRGQTELIAQLREKAKIERLDKKGAPAPAMTAPPAATTPPPAKK